MAENLDNIRKLSPKERLARLRELEEERKREIEEATMLMQESQDEIKKEDTIKQIIINEDERARKKEEEEKKKKAGEESEQKSLEKTVSEEEVAETAGKGVQYKLQFSEIYAENPNPESLADRSVYSALQGLRNRAADGSMTPEDERLANVLRESFHRVEYVPPGVRASMTRAEQMFEQIEAYKTRKK